MFRQLSMTATDLLHRRAALAVLESAAERDAIARKAKCGRACDDLAGYEQFLEMRLLEKIE
jgi:hypothetical protein